MNFEEDHLNSALQIGMDVSQEYIIFMTDDLKPNMKAMILRLIM